MKIVSNLTILNYWFGCKYNNTNNLLELYNDFSSGAIDKGAPIAQSARICALAGRSKTGLTKCDPTAGIGDIVSFLAHTLFLNQMLRLRLKKHKPRLRLMPSTLSDLSYQCGFTLQEVETEEGHILKSVFVRKNLTCEVNMELTYYSAGFDPVCFYCGGEDNLQTPEDKYSVCDMRLSGKKTFVQKRGRAGKEKAK